MIVDLKPGIEQVGIDARYQWDYPVSAKASKVKSVWYIALPITSAHRSVQSRVGSEWKGVSEQKRGRHEGCVYPHASLVEMITYHEKHFPNIPWKYLDASHYDWHEIQQMIRDDPPDVAAFTVYTATYLWALILAGYIKSVNPECLTIFGNDHASLLKKEILFGRYGEAVVDFIGDGNNGPFTMMGVLSHLEGGTPIDRIPSLAYRANGSGMITQPAHTYPLDRRILPDYRLIDDYLQANYDPAFEYWYADAYDLKRMVTFQMASGCNWGAHPDRRCKHCSIQGLTPKTGYIPAVVERFEQIVGDLKANIYSAGDSTMGFTSTQWGGDPFLDELREACSQSDILKGKRFLKMYGLVREFLESAPLHQPFCHTWNVGIEAFDPALLKGDSKGINPESEMLYEAMELARTLDFQVTPSGILGLPGTTLTALKQEVDNWLALVEEYKDVITLIGITLPGIIPGSRMYYELYSENDYVRRSHGELIPSRPLSKAYIESTTEVTIEDVEAALQDVARGIVAISEKYNTPIRVGINSLAGREDNIVEERRLLDEVMSSVAAV